MALGGLWWRSGFPWAPRRLAWQAWHLATSIFTLRGRRGTGWHPPSLCVAGVALTALGVLWWRSGFPWARRRLAWQAWHLATSSLCVAGVALGDIHLHFAWEAWHLRHWAGSGRALVAQRVPVGAAGSRVAGVALGDIYLHFAWQAWHSATATFTLRGRRGTYGTGRALVAQRVPMGAAASRVAGVALGDILFAWQAWRWVTSTFTLRGRRGTYLGYRVVLFLTFLFHCHCCHLARWHWCHFAPGNVWQLGRWQFDNASAHLSKT